MENITTVEAAFEACGLDPNKRPDFSSVPEEFREYIQNHYELVVITKALNKRPDGTFWKPDYTDRDQPKYSPWWEVDDESGFAFSSSGYDGWDAHSDVGSRLCMESPEHVRHSQKHFEGHHLKNQLK